jgi:AraC-like DNA-binding protein
VKARSSGADLRVERGPDLDAGVRQHDAPVLVFPLGRSAVSVRTGGIDERLDRSCFALVPARTPYRLAARTSAPEVVTLVLLPGSWESAVHEYRPYVESRILSEVVSRFRTFARTRWIDELGHRYLFERDVCKKHSSQAARFLETEFAKEVYFLGKEEIEGQARASLARDEKDVVKRALEWIDARLFDPFSLEDLARRCHTSESTLLRDFRRETGATPAAYLRERRLQEAHLLLQGDRWSVGEIARRVGYTNVAAFTAAFGRRFGVPPSEARAAVDASKLLPPHGQPPLVREGGRRKKTR